MRHSQDIGKRERMERAAARSLKRSTINEKCGRTDPDIQTETIGYCIRRKDHEGAHWYTRIGVEL